jgi:hypothetical protein
MNKKESIVVQPFKQAGDWAAQVKIIREKFPKLTEADLKLVKGKEHEMLKRIEIRLGKSRFEVQTILKEITAATT